MALFKHQTDRRLRESEERYRALVEQTGEGIAYLGREARFEFANSAAEGIFGVEGDGLSGRSLADFTQPAELSRLLGDVHGNSHVVKNTSTLTIDRPDGARRDLLVTTTAARDALGSVVGVFVVFRDMTGRPDPGKVYCANGRMLPEFSLLDEPPSDGKACPLAAMRPAVEGSLMDMQSALGDLLATPLSAEQKARIDTLQHSVEELRQLIEKGLMHLRLGARFIRLAHAGRPAAERVP
jgi:PAS domain S-box-containing protein